MNIEYYILILISGIFAGAINAIAGGGTFITFPTLMYAGLPSIQANATNGLAIFPGHAGSLLPNKNYIKEAFRKLKPQLICCFFGGVTGSLLLIFSSEKLFKLLVPILIFSATLLFAYSGKIQKLHVKINSEKTKKNLQLLLLFLITIYGGYFGAGQGIMLLAILSITENLELNILNLLKNLYATVANTIAAVLFAFSGLVVWKPAFILLIGAIIGGFIGGRLNNIIPPALLRKFIVSVGAFLTIYYSYTLV